MFVQRAFETSRLAFSKHLLSLTCAASVTLLALCVVPKVSAQTYRPSAVNCASGTGYQAPVSAPTSPSPTGSTAQLVATGLGDGTYYQVKCTWSGFSNVVTTATKTLYVSAQVSSQWEGFDTCGIGFGNIQTNYGSWTSSCTGKSANLTYVIPANTNLSTINVTGLAKVHPQEFNVIELDITNIYIQ